MKLLKLSRTLKEGFINFRRNGWLSVGTISVLAISLYIVSFTLLIGYTANFVLQNIQEKINITVYFSPEVKQERIMGIKEKLAGFSEIKSVDFVSREQALQELEQLSSRNEVIKDAIKEVGGNPLPDSLVIKANNPDQYEIIAKAIENSVFRDDIININYEQNKREIENLNKIVNLIKKAGMGLGIIFIFLALLITFNTIHITMYSHKQEFEVKRLVGASNIYVQMPFVFEGIFYGFFSAIISIIFIFITAKYISSLSQKMLGISSLMPFYWSHFWILFGILILLGIILGVISSFIAIRRYLKV